MIEKILVIVVASTIFTYCAQLLAGTFDDHDQVFLFKTSEAAKLAALFHHTKVEV